MPKTPLIIQGDTFSDDRGLMRFVNDFHFEDVTRMYLISPATTDIIRAWQGHKVEKKYFFVTNGAFRVYLIAPDNWTNPSKDCKVLKYDLLSIKSQILVIPEGYINGFRALENNSQLIILSSSNLQYSKNAVLF